MANSQLFWNYTQGGIQVYPGESFALSDADWFKYGTNDFRISLAFRPDSTAPYQSSNTYLVMKYNGGNGRGWGIGYNLETGTIWFLLCDDNSNVANFSSAAGVILPNVINHVVYEIDKSNMAVIYVNGVEVASNLVSHVGNVDVSGAGALELFWGSFKGYFYQLSMSGGTGCIKGIDGVLEEYYGFIYGCDRVQPSYDTTKTNWNFRNSLSDDSGVYTFSTNWSYYNSEHADHPSYDYAPQFDHYYDLNNSLNDSPASGKSALNLGDNGISWTTDWAGRATQAIDISSGYAYISNNNDISDLGATWTIFMEFLTGSDVTTARNILQCHDYTNGWYVKIENGTVWLTTLSGGVAASTTPIAILASRWYQIVFTRTGSKIYTYINGENKAEDTKSAPGHSTDHVLVGPSGSWSGMKISRLGFLKGTAYNSFNVNILYQCSVDCGSGVYKRYCHNPETKPADGYTYDYPYYYGPYYGLMYLDMNPKYEYKNSVMPLDNFTRSLDGTGILTKGADRRSMMFSFVGIELEQKKALEGAYFSGRQALRFYIDYLFTTDWIEARITQPLNFREIFSTPTEDYDLMPIEDWPSALPTLDHFFSLNRTLIDTQGNDKSSLSLGYSGTWSTDFWWTTDWALREYQGIGFNGGGYLSFWESDNDNISDISVLGEAYTIFLEFKTPSDWSTGFWLLYCIGGSPANGYRLGVDTSGLLMFETLLSGRTDATTPIQLQTSTYYQMVISRKEGTDIAKIYLNGVERSSDDLGTPGTPDLSGVGVYSGIVFGGAGGRNGFIPCRLGFLNGKSFTASQVLTLYDSWSYCGNRVWKRHPDSIETKTLPLHTPTIKRFYSCELYLEDVYDYAEL